MADPAPCPACATPARLAFVTPDRNRRIGKQSFHYHRCPRCRLIFLEPLPADLGPYYPEDYYPLPESLAQLVARADAERYKIETVRRFVPGGRLLEIGPGPGVFAYLAKEAGFAVETIEMDGRCCEFLRDEVGVGATQTADVVGALADGSEYDVVALWHVIEHLPDPWRTLSAAATRLSPDGVIAVAAPNPDSLQFRLLRRRWLHVDAPRHFSLIPLSLLLARAGQLGLAVAHSTTNDEGALFCNLAGWTESLRVAAPFVPNRIVTRVGATLTALAAPVERRRNLGSAYTVVLRRESAS